MLQKCSTVLKTSTLRQHVIALYYAIGVSARKGVRQFTFDVTKLMSPSGFLPFRAEQIELCGHDPFSSCKRIFSFLKARNVNDTVTVYGSFVVLSREKKLPLSQNITTKHQFWKVVIKKKKGSSLLSSSSSSWQCFKHMLCSEGTVYRLILSRQSVGNRVIHYSQFIRGSNRRSGDWSQGCGSCCHGDSGGIVGHTAVGGEGEGAGRRGQVVSTDADPQRED